MIAGALKRLGGVLSVSALVGLGALAVAACSAGGEEELGTGDTEVDVVDFESVGSVTQAISEHCWDPASSTFATGFETPYVSEATYNDCYLAKVVEIQEYDNRFVSGGYTSVGWGDKSPPTDSECLRSYVTAYLFEEVDNKWQFVKMKKAHGDLKNDDKPGDIVPPPAQPYPEVQVPRSSTPPDGIGPIKRPVTNCQPPVVYFHGDEMKRNGKYRISAITRVGKGSTRPIRFAGKSGTCGYEGEKCCWSGAQCWNTNQEQCGADGKCEQCGWRGEKCCTSLNGQPYCRSGANATCQAGTCIACGGNGEVCCADSPACNSGLTCGSGGKCAPPPCGKEGQQCCKSGNSCESGLTCTNGSCKKPQEPACGWPNAPCCGSSCIHNGIACINGTCTNPPGDCTAPGDGCCYGQGGVNYCDSKYVQLKCNNLNKCVAD